jgi:protein pelota
VLSTAGKRKLRSQEAHAKAMTRFFENVLTALERHLNFEVCKCVVIASPGFVKDEFHKFMMAETQRRGLRAFQENRSIFILCHSSSGHKHAVSEILQKPEMQARLGDTKAAGEVKILHQFFQTLKEDDTRAYYGPQSAMDANELQAVEHLLITEELFRAASLAERKKYVALVESVRENSGQVHIFSSLHTSGEQLQRLSGIAVILRYPIPDLDVTSESESESDDERPAAASSSSSSRA